MTAIASIMIDFAEPHLPSKRVRSLQTEGRSMSGAAAGSAKAAAVPTEFAVQCDFTRHSPKIIDRAAKGLPFGGISIRYVRANGKTYMMFVLLDVFVASYQSGPSHGGNPTYEVFALSAGKSSLQVFHD